MISMLPPMSGNKPVEKLDRWLPTEVDKHYYNEDRQNGRLSPGAALRIYWEYKIPRLLNSQVLLPKFVQLLYWIITGTITDGKRRNRIKIPDCGLCPFCNVTADCKHMFATCPMTRHVWAEIDNLGAVHFRKYRNFDYNRIQDYHAQEPVAVYMVMGLWSIWCQWLHIWNRMIELGACFCVTAHRGDWLNEVMHRFKCELIFRIAEASAVDQWLIVVKRRALIKAQNRLPAEMQSDDVDLEHDLIPEKQFLAQGTGNRRPVSGATRHRPPRDCKCPCLARNHLVAAANRTYSSPGKSSSGPSAPSSPSTPTARPRAPRCRWR